MLELPLQADPEVIMEGVNLVWVLIAAFLVFFMHAGFGMLESGQVRSKNVANQLTKNLLTWGVGVIAYFIVGAGVSALVAALTSGGSTAGAFAYINGGSTAWASWLFGAAFSMVAASIVSGAVAERAQLGGYLVFTVFVGALIYPVATGLTWGGGFLAQLGFQDFAGAAVVHMTGGVCGLTAAYVLGPRLGKYNDDGSANVIPGHSLPYAVLGTLILAFGWFGFNVGTAVEVFQIGDGGELALADYAYAGRVALNTALVMGAGSIGAALVGYVRRGKVDTLMTANGLLAGLVSVCSIAAVSSWTGTLVVGFIAGVQVPLVFELLERVGIDDVCAVFPVHGSAGVLSALAYPFVDTTSAFSLAQLGTQVVGVVVLAAWAAGITLVVYGGLKLVGWARVSKDEEIDGLDASEHGIETYPEFGGNVVNDVGSPSPTPGKTPTADGGEVSDDD
ncbi:ammonium transporter [Natronomonas sp. CBA1123]|uniref:ammonium transporter n=1 Tax=Natronomonas sp. CBA1123 TaxID=2668070 RepID=UPI0018D21D6C|nr:ammonium transporter [Natronomonas sp. CBA1123]